jgi:hypothetical protein
LALPLDASLSIPWEILVPALTFLAGLGLGRLWRRGKLDVLFEDRTPPMYVDQRPARLAPRTTETGGQCRVERFVFDSSDGVRREVKLHTICHNLPAEDQPERAQFVINSSRPGLDHRLIASRVSLHDPES